MKSAIILSTLLSSVATAFPSLAANLPEDVHAQLAHHQVKREAYPGQVSQARSLLDPIAADILALGGVAASILDLSNKRPEPGYVYQDPKPTDSRGPCPGLNLLANYGYLPRNGHITYAQALDATSRGFNMSPDLTTVLAVFAILADGDIATESFYLGAGPGGVGGLNRHSTVEADVSPNREDYYLGCGDNHHLSSRLFTQNVQLAALTPLDPFGMFTMGSQYALNSGFSKQYNPYLYYFPFPLIVSLGAFAFYPAFMSNGTYGLGGSANYASISNIIGAKYNTSTQQFTYVPEKWADNWYRRATPYTAVEALADAFTLIYPRNPIVPAFGQIGTPNFNATTALCDVYQGINSVIPLFIAGGVEAQAAALTWALSKLDPYFKNTVLGCPTSTLSPNFMYTNASNTGGPLNPPKSVLANDGDNVYNKTYFKTAPMTPQCSHAS